MTCRVDGCDRVLNNRSHRGLCNAHYLRWRRTGETGSVNVRVFAPGRTCSVADCPGPVHARGLCSPHYQRSWKGLEVDARPIGDKWTSEGNYSTLHYRLQKALGSASAHVCAHCQSRAAQEWAYDHADPDEMTGTNGGDRQLPFSMKTEHYLPLCIPCHRRFDRRQRR